MKFFLYLLISMASFLGDADALIPCKKNIALKSTGYKGRQQSMIHLKFLETTDDGPSIQLSPDEDDAIRAAAKVLSEGDAFGVGWFDRPEAWIQAKQDYPILAIYEDSDLRDAYLKQKPRILELFTDTPFGPFLLINLLFKFSGFTWCDTPFGQDTACPPL